MNIKKNVRGFSRITNPTYITKDWNRIDGYKTRGYRLRVRRIGISRMIIDNPKLVIRIKRNRVFGLIYKSYKK